MAKQTENNTRRHVKTVRLTDDELDEINHIANIAVMKLVSNFYQVKSITVDAQTRDDLGFHLIMKMCRKHGIG